MKFSIAFFLISFGFSWAQLNPWSLCPEPETITPCECVKDCEGECDAIFHCANLTKQSQIDEVIKKSDFPFRIASIEDSSLQYLSHELFDSEQFRLLTVKSSSFMTLLDEPLEKYTTLITLLLDNVVVLRGLTFDVFSPMKNLSVLDIKNTEVGNIQNDICRLLPNTLKAFYLDNTKTSMIDDYAFASCSSFEHLSITGGLIKTVKNSMFPKNLLSLDLTNNKIENLPDDFLYGFHQLNSIYLDENQLTYIEENVFGNLPSLLYLNVEKNPTVCDCKLRWQMSHVRPYIAGTCTNLNKEMYELSEKDFALC